VSSEAVRENDTLGCDKKRPARGRSFFAECVRA
jgi:hypothetical protein